MASQKPMTRQKVSRPVDPFMVKLHEITAKEIDALTKVEIDFLKARSSYLTEDEAEKFDVILNPKKPKTKAKK